MARSPKPILILLTALAIGLAAGYWLRPSVLPPGSDPDPYPVPEKTLSGAMQALDLWAAQRAYPGRVVPDVGLALAFEETQGLRSLAAGSGIDFDSSADPWTSLGPANIGGRTLALALRPGNPDILFAGSASGGLWKSTTGGVGADAWDYVETGYPVLAVSTIAIDTADPDVMFIGTGEVYRYQDAVGGDVDRTTRGSYGIGILKSIDGGATWSQSLDWTYEQTRGVWSIRIHPTDSDIVYAATTEGTYKSIDAGGSWTPVHSVIMATDLRIHPTNPDIVLVACGNFGSAGTGIYKTINGGQSWTKVSAGLPASWTGKAMIDIARTSPNFVYASVSNTYAGFGLYQSQDTGDTWTRVNTTDFQQWQGWYSHWVLASPFNHYRVFVGGIDIWRTLSGGPSLTKLSDWTQIYLGTPPPEGPGGGPKYAHADQHFAIAHPADENTLFFASDGGVFKTTDGGNSYVGLNGGYVTSQFYQGFANSGGDEDLAIGGMQDNLTAIYEGTVAWRRVIGGDGSWAAINAKNDMTVFGSYQNLNLLRSYDGGANWTEIPPPVLGGEASAFIAPFVLSPSDTNILYAGRTRVSRSVNQGSNWSITNGAVPLDGSNVVFSMAISATDPDVVYAATAPGASRGRVFRTRDGGGIWDDITGSLPDRYLSDLAVDPRDDRKVFITLMGFGSSHVFSSWDGGDSWVDIGSGLPDVPASAVEVDPLHSPILYVGTDLGAYVSPDYGHSWFPFMRGMPTAMINDLKVFAPARKIRAATHGNGVFERDLIDPVQLAAGEEETGLVPRIGLRVAPNPLRRAGLISFRLEEPASVELALFDVSGRQVARVLEGRREAGEHTVPLERGALAQGVYFLRLDTGRRRAVTRVVFLR